MSKTTLAIAALLVAIFAFAFGAILIRYSENEIGSKATIFNRFWISAVMFGVWTGANAVRRLLLKKPSTSIQAIQELPNTVWELGLILTAGIAISADLLLWAWSLTQTSVANASLLGNCPILFTVLIGWIFWKPPIDSRLGLGIVITLAGAIAMEIGDFQISRAYANGDLAAFLSSGCLGVYLLLVAQLRTRFSVTTVLLWTSTVAAVFSGLVIVTAEGSLFPKSWQGWLTVIVLAISSQILGQGLITYSLSQLSSEFVCVAHLLEPVLAAILAWMFFSERLTFSNWLAFAVVLVGIYLAISSESAVKKLESKAS